MSNEQFIESWEREKQRLAAMGREWSLADALLFSMRSADVWDAPADRAAGAALPTA